MEMSLSFTEAAELFQPLYEARGFDAALERVMDFLVRVLDFDESIVAFSFPGLSCELIKENRLIASEGSLSAHQKKLYNERYHKLVNDSFQAIDARGRVRPINCAKFPQDAFINEFIVPQGIASFYGDCYRASAASGFVTITINSSRFDEKAYEENARRLQAIHSLLQAVFDNAKSRRSSGAAADRDMAGPYGKLSLRENEVARLLARRLSSREIAEKLCVSRRTAETHIFHIYQKIDVHGRASFLSWLGER
jgi:DNA-binding CsgD family transcriptional regulator